MTCFCLLTLHMGSSVRTGEKKGGMMVQEELSCEEIVAELMYFCLVYGELTWKTLLELLDVFSEAAFRRLSRSKPALFWHFMTENEYWSTHNHAFIFSFSCAPVRSFPFCRCKKKGEYCPKMYCKCSVWGVTWGCMPRSIACSGFSARWFLLIYALQLKTFLVRKVWWSLDQFVSF